MAKTRKYTREEVPGEPVKRRKYYARIEWVETEGYVEPAVVLSIDDWLRFKSFGFRGHLELEPFPMEKPDEQSKA